jgi:hypothetical protein
MPVPRVVSTTFQRKKKQSTPKSNAGKYRLAPLFSSKKKRKSKIKYKDGNELFGLTVCTYIELPIWPSTPMRNS